MLALFPSFFKLPRRPFPCSLHCPIHRRLPPPIRSPQQRASRLPPARLHRLGPRPVPPLSARDSPATAAPQPLTYQLRFCDGARANLAARSFYDGPQQNGRRILPFTCRAFIDGAVGQGTSNVLLFITSLKFHTLPLRYTSSVSLAYQGRPLDEWH